MAMLHAAADLPTLGGVVVSHSQVELLDVAGSQLDLIGHEPTWKQP